jgi:hypothetical protein
MAPTVNQRRWILGLALASTLTCVASMQDKDESDNTVVQPNHLKPRQLQKNEQGDSQQVGDGLVAKMNRQRLPENEKDMFVSKSWFVPPPPPKAVQPTAPPLPFVYMGKLAEEGENLIILLSKQNRNYQVKVGDVLDNTYHVDEVRPPIMTLTYLPLNIKQTIQIGASN